jgi:sarcosine oxidase subunit gamma
MANAGRADSAARNQAQAGREFSGPGVKLTVLPPAYRMSLRASGASVAALSKALGLALPQQPKRSISKGSCTALWLGPDEWLVIEDGARDPLKAFGGVEALHSAVDISHRNVALLVAGPAAASTINAGCPQDLSVQAFQVGACSRTVLGKVEIVLLRTGDDSFRVECWRSFSDYVFAFLADAAGHAAV